MSNSYSKRNTPNRGQRCTCIPTEIQLLLHWQVLTEKNTLAFFKVFTEHIQNQNESTETPSSKSTSIAVEGIGVKDGALAPGSQVQATTLFWQGWWRRRNSLPSPKGSGHNRGWLASYLGRPSAISMSLPSGKSQSGPMSLHHPFHIHLSYVSKVQYIMYPMLFPHSVPSHDLEFRPNQGRDLLIFWPIQVSCPFWERYQNVTTDSLTSTWHQIWPGTKHKGAEKDKAIRTHYIYIYIIQFWNMDTNTHLQYTSTFCLKLQRTFYAIQVGQKWGFLPAVLLVQNLVL